MGAGERERAEAQRAGSGELGLPGPRLAVELDRVAREEGAGQVHPRSLERRMNGLSRDRDGPF